MVKVAGASPLKTSNEGQRLKHSQLNKLKSSPFYGSMLLIVAIFGCGEAAQNSTKQRLSQTNEDLDANKADTGDVLAEDGSMKSGSKTPAPSSSPTPSNSPSPQATATPVVSNPVNSSKGSGGANGLVEMNYTDTRGLASAYKINAPADAGTAKAYGLHVHLHGDGGGGYRDYPNRETRDGLIGVTVRAPNATLQWGRAQGVAHANYLNDLIQNEILKKYNIDLSRIYFSGVSGGSYFLSGHYIPMFGKIYESGVFLMCGGMTPQVTFDSPAFLKKFRIHWQVTAGERTDITTSVTAAIQAYKQNLQQNGGESALQSSETLGPGGHCVFDNVSYTSGIQYMMDLKFKSILKQ